MINLFKKEPYPSFPEDWKNPDNTVFREFYLTSSPDFEILQSLVRQHMSEQGNEEITRYRLLCILRECGHRAFYLHAQRRKHPRTWRIRWKWRCLKLFFHRRFKTRYFREQVELCRVAAEVVKRLEENIENE